MAKRVRAPTEAPATGGEELSASQLSQAVHQMRAQAILDHQWMTIVEEAVSQHAECIEDVRLKGAQLKADTVRIAQSLQAVATTVEENDANLKTGLRTAEATLSSTDAATKKTIETEIALLKQVVDGQAKATADSF